MLKRFLKNEKGLTLIELLAVVVILGIIAAIAIPAIGKIIDDSKHKAVISDALQVINAAKIAKAANPYENKFEANGNTSTRTDSTAIELDSYLDTKVTGTVTVTFSSGDVTISGHEVNQKYYNNNSVTEKELIDALEGTSGTGGTGDPDD